MAGRRGRKAAITIENQKQRKPNRKRSSPRKTNQAFKTYTKNPGKVTYPLNLKFPIARCRNITQ